MDYDGFKLEKKNGMAIITLNRPEKLNALTREMIDVQFPELFPQLEKDTDVHTLIITGTGRGFCSGADVGALASGRRPGQGGDAYERLQPIGGFASKLYYFLKPTIAAVNGMAAGAGASIAMLCDIRIASDAARFSIAFVRRGLVPDCGATFLMPRLIGSAKAFELMYTGDIIDAQEALKIGLVNKVVPADKLMDETTAFAKRLGEGPPLALAQIKRAIHAGIMNNIESQLFLESYAQNFCFNTEDFKEGVNSFLEKRPPKFQGK